MAEDTAEGLRDAIRVDTAELRGHVDAVVRSSVEETLNALLQAEADGICGATRYARSPERVDTRAGSYERKLETKAGVVTLKVPKLRSLPFETAIIERYRRRESSVEEALVEMYLAGVSVRRVEDIPEALWGTRVSSGTVSRLNQKIYRHIEAWRNRTIEGEFPYLFLDGVVLKRSWAGEVRNVSVLVAIGVGTDGHRQIVGVAEGQKEDLEGWRGFLRHLKERGLAGVAADHFRCVHRSGRSGRRALPRRAMAALRRAFLSKRVHQRAEGQGRRRGAHAESDPRPGRSPFGRGQGARSDCEATRDALNEGGRACRSQSARDADLFCVPEQSLATGSHQQSARTNHSRDSPAHARGRCLSRRTFRIDAGRGATAIHREYEMGQAALSRDGNVAQSASRGGSCLRSDQATAIESAKHR